jgi:hypothetical protein
MQILQEQISVHGHMLAFLAYVHVGNSLPTFHVGITQNGQFTTVAGKGLPAYLAGLPFD